jgi:hypothetical protein
MAKDLKRSSGSGGEAGHGSPGLEGEVAPNGACGLLERSAVGAEPPRPPCAGRGGGWTEAAGSGAATPTALEAARASLTSHVW